MNKNSFLTFSTKNLVQKNCLRYGVDKLCVLADGTRTIRRRHNHGLLPIVCFTRDEYGNSDGDHACKKKCVKILTKHDFFNV